MDSTPSVRRGVYARRPGAISVITGIRWNEQPVNARGYISKYCDLTPIILNPTELPNPDAEPGKAYWRLPDRTGPGQSAAIHRYPGRKLPEYAS